jgi:hypothetical protein
MLAKEVFPSGIPGLAFVSRRIMVADIIGSEIGEQVGSPFDTPKFEPGDALAGR